LFVVFADAVVAAVVLFVAAVVVAAVVTVGDVDRFVDVASVTTVSGVVDPSTVTVGLVALSNAHDAVE